VVVTETVNVLWRVLRYPGLAVLLSCLLTAQLRASPFQEEGSPPTSLKIVIVEGDGAINNVKERTAREVIVEVQDENNKPVGGASVVFLLPNGGASGSFADGARMLAVVTGDNGRAVATGLKPNGIAGEFQIRVTANLGGSQASTSIGQTNAASVAAAGASSTKWIIILAVAGGAAAGVALAAGGGGSTPAASSPPSTPPPPAVSLTTIGLGSGTVGQP
jgi:hypothetical protein